MGEEKGNEIDKEVIRQRIREQAKKIKIRGLEDEDFNESNLEYKNRRQRKTAMLEEKYKNKPKIAFHTLTEEGNKKLMQLKKDRIWTTLGWMFVGNVGGLVGASYFHSNSKRWKSPNTMYKREIAKVVIFFGSVALFTYYGFGKARQTFIKEKLKLVEDHSIGYTEK